MHALEVGQGRLSNLRKISLAEETLSHSRIHAAGPKSSLESKKVGRQ